MESEEWDHPEGLDFKNGRAWVMVGREYLLITDEGKVLTREPFMSVLPWNEECYIFVNSEGKRSLVSKDGQIELSPFSEGLAPVWNNSSKGDRSSTSDPCAGYIDRTGALVIPKQFSRTLPFFEELGAVSRRIQGRTTGYYFTRNTPRVKEM